MEIPKATELESKVFTIKNEQDFQQIALAVFNFQYSFNPLYKQYCDIIHRTPATINAVDKIPFLPISFFKTSEVKTTEFTEQATFRSSGTTASMTSRHLVKDLKIYEQSFTKCFELFYGNIDDYCILGLLPSYLERQDSSLIYMVNVLIRHSKHTDSGFYLYDHDKLAETLARRESSGQKTILFGVSYALLDFAESHPMSLKHTTIIETGGMKGRKKEVTKEELYQQLKTAFQVNEIHSEYGMTELLSQAYGINGLYETPSWMRIVLREESDPFNYAVVSGAINIIDLANIYSCSFIATDDLGRRHAKGKFEVLGRLDNSDIRGCSQLIL
jgi:hypothetical protein